MFDVPRYFKSLWLEEDFGVIVQRHVIHTGTDEKRSGCKPEATLFVSSFLKRYES